MKRRFCHTAHINGGKWHWSSTSWIIVVEKVAFFAFFLKGRRQQQESDCLFVSSDRSSCSDDVLLYIQPIFEIFSVNANIFKVLSIYAKDRSSFLIDTDIITLLLID